MLEFRSASNSIQSPTDGSGSFRSTPTEFSAWATYPETTRFRNWPPRQVGTSSNQPPLANHTNVASPPNSQSRGRKSYEHSDDSGDEDSDHSSDEDSSQISDEDPNQSIEEDSGPSGGDDSDPSSDESSDPSSDKCSDQSSDEDPDPRSDEDLDQGTGEEENEAPDPEAVLEAIRERINSCIVVNAKKTLNAHQKLTRRKTFDLEKSEAKGGMIFDYKVPPTCYVCRRTTDLEAVPKDEDSMVIDLLCRIHDSREIQDEEGPTLIVVANDREIAKWRVAAQDFSDRFQNSILIYHGPRRSAAARFEDYRIVITTYRVLSGDMGLLESGLLKDGFRFLRVILDGGEVIRNTRTQQSKACLEVNALYHWCCTKNSNAIAPNQYEAFAKFLRIPNPDEAPISKEFLDQFILLPPDENAVYEATPPTSELDNRFLVFQKVNFDRGQWKFYRALEKRLDEVGGRHLRPRALRRDGGDIVRRMILLSLRACCHPKLALRDPGEIPNHDDERKCNICQERIDPGDNSRFCPSCDENVISNFPEGPSRLANPKVREMLAILRRTEKNTHGLGKMAIVCQLDDFADIIADHLSREQFQFARFHDSNRRQKEQAMETLRRLRNPATVALITVNLGDTQGLDLREFSTVILMDLWWDPRLDARRFLMDHDVRVNIYKLYFAQSIERRALELLTQPQLIGDNNQGFIQQLGIRSTPYNLDFLLQPA